MRGKDLLSHLAAISSANKLFALLLVSIGICGVGKPTPAYAYAISIDNFYVERGDNPNGGLPFTFNDEFNDGIPPPSAPNFSTGNPASYSVTGIPPLGSEAAGKLTLNGSNAQPTLINSTQYTYEGALLLTNIIPDSFVGLRQSSAIDVIGIFDLTAPSTNEHYGIRLTDQTSASHGDDDVRMIIRGMPNGDVDVQFWRVDLTALTIDVLGSDVLSASDLLNPQILLMLSVDTTGDVSGSYDIGGGLVPIVANTTPSLFHGETFTRAAFFVVNPVPNPGTLFLVALALGLLGLFVRRNTV
jgi:PEP-CTERM motif